MTIKLIVGLGNIDKCYVNTRHNFGAMYVKLLAKRYGVLLRKNKELYGYVGKLELNNNIIRLLVPNSYINESGLSVSACMHMYQLNPLEILVAHDELDLLPGILKIKLGRNLHDSHHGVQNIVLKLGNKFNFYRLRIGIGRPLDKNKIIEFVLSQPSYDEKNVINNIINLVIQNTESLIYKNFSQFINKLYL